MAIKKEYTEDQPIFVKLKYKNGWMLRLTKLNDYLLSTSLYEPSGQGVEAKGWELQDDESVSQLREYIRLFEIGPDKSYNDYMAKINVN